MVHQDKLRQDDAALIDAWLQSMMITGLTDLTIQVRARYLSQYCRLLPRPAPSCTVDELRLALAEYRKTHAQNSVRQMAIYVELFLAYHMIKGVPEINAMMPPRKFNTKRAGDMLTSEDVEALVKACRTSRDRALISVMYEGGFRPIELSRLVWEDVKWDQYGAVINTDQKTGKPRYIRLVSSVPALAQWQQDCHQETGPVFRGLRAGHENGTGITTHSIADIVYDAAEAAGIKKRVHPYLLRHTRVTHLLEDGVPESVIKLQHWGSLTTPMLATYGHISNAHIDRVMLDHAGIEPPAKRDRASPRPVQCQKCKTLNLPGSARCSFCGLAFTQEALMEETEFTAFMNDPDRLIRFGQFLKKMRAGKE